MSQDKGIRSVEVNISNMTEANFTIQSSEPDANAEWIKNEEPATGSQFIQYTSARWGAMTQDYNSVAGGYVNLTGYGDPIHIAFSNDQKQHSNCTATSTSTVKAVVNQVGTGEQAHSQYNITLTAIG